MDFFKSSIVNRDRSSVSFAEETIEIRSKEIHDEYSPAISFNFCNVSNCIRFFTSSVTRGSIRVEETCVTGLERRRGERVRERRFRRGDRDRLCR